MLRDWEIIRQRTAGGFGNEAPILGFSHTHWNRPAGFPGTRIGPEIGKVPALLGFHGLEGAEFAVEEGAFAVGLVEQRQSPTIGSEAGKTVDEGGFGHPKVCSI